MNNKIFKISSNHLHSLFIYDLVSQRVSHVGIPAEIILASLYCSITKISENTYLIHGGFLNGDYLKSTILLDINTAEVRQFPQSNIGRGQCGGILMNESVYIFGGGSHGQASLTSSCEKFNLEAQT